MKGIIFSFFIFLLISRSQKVDISKLEIQSFWALIGCMALTPLNWLFEWFKWKLILDKLDEKNNTNNFIAFVSGIVSSFLTPSLSGNFLGRIMFYDKSKRWKITILSVIANFSQFLVSIVFGLMGLFLNQSIPFKSNAFLLISGSVIIILFYFFGENLVKKIPINKFQMFCNQMSINSSRLNFLLLSFMRFIIFIIQYILALNAFGIEITLETIYLILTVFLFITLTPSLFFGKIMVRESIAVTIFGYAGHETLPVIFASFTTWFFNLFLIALIALFIVKKSNR